MDGDVEQPLLVDCHVLLETPKPTRYLVALTIPLVEVLVIRAHGSYFDFIIRACPEISIIVIVRDFFVRVQKLLLVFI